MRGTEIHSVSIGIQGLGRTGRYEMSTKVGGAILNLFNLRGSHFNYVLKYSSLSGFIRRYIPNCS